MWGFIQSICLIVPVKVTGLLWSNSAEIEWCAASGAVTVRTSALMIAIDARRAIDISLFDSVNGLGNLPHFDRAFENAMQVVLVARIFHQHVRGFLGAPRPDVHPFLRE